MTELESVIATSPRLRDRTKQVYLASVRRFLTAVGSDPSAWTGVAAQRFYNELLNNGTTAKTANNVLFALRYAGKRMALNRADPRLNFAAAVELRREEAAPTTAALSRQDAIELLASCAGARPRDLRDRAIISWMLHTGMRRSSLCGLTRGDLDDREVRIQLKGGRRHAIPLTDSMRADIQPWLRWLQLHDVAGGRLFRSLRNTLRGIEIGDNLSDVGLYALLTARRAHVTSGHRLNPHSFRHTFVTWCQERAVPTHAIVAITGHQLEKGATIVDRTYTDHRVAGTRAIDAIDAYLREGGLRPEGAA